MGTKRYIPWRGHSSTKGGTKGGAPSREIHKGRPSPPFNRPQQERDTESNVVHEIERAPRILVVQCVQGDAQSTSNCRLSLCA